MCERFHFVMRAFVVNIDVTISDKYKLLSKEQQDRWGRRRDRKKAEILMMSGAKCLHVYFWLLFLCVCRKDEGTVPSLLDQAEMTGEDAKQSSSDVGKGTKSKKTSESR